MRPLEEILRESDLLADAIQKRNDELRRQIRFTERQQRKLLVEQVVPTNKPVQTGRSLT